LVIEFDHSSAGVLTRKALSHTFAALGGLVVTT
jgi:hypothetical protein